MPALGTATTQLSLDGRPAHRRDPAALLDERGVMLNRVRRAKPEARIDRFIVQEMAVLPRAFVLIVGSSVDPVFGPVVLFGQGGTAVISPAPLGGDGSASVREDDVADQRVDLLLPS